MHQHMVLTCHSSLGLTDGNAAASDLMQDALLLTSAQVLRVLATSWKVLHGGQMMPQGAANALAHGPDLSLKSGLDRRQRCSL